MMTVIPEMPMGVVAIRATGHVTAEDYEGVLIPAVEEAYKEFGKVRLLYHLDKGFESFSAHAMWDDAKVGLKHLMHFSKIAIVSDAAFIRGAVKVLGLLIPGEVQIYAEHDVESAKRWIVS